MAVYLAIECEICGNPRQVHVNCEVCGCVLCLVCLYMEFGQIDVTIAHRQIKLTKYCPTCIQSRKQEAEKPDNKESNEDKSPTFPDPGPDTASGVQKNAEVAEADAAGTIFQAEAVGLSISLALEGASKRETRARERTVSVGEADCSNFATTEATPKVKGPETIVEVKLDAAAIAKFQAQGAIPKVKKPKAVVAEKIPALEPIPRAETAVKTGTPSPLRPRDLKPISRLKKPEIIIRDNTVQYSRVRGLVKGTSPVGKKPETAIPTRTQVQRTIPKVTKQEIVTKEKPGTPSPSRLPRIIPRVKQQEDTKKKQKPETIVKEIAIQTEAVSNEKSETIIKENTVQIEAVGIEKPETVVEENTIRAEAVSNEKPETVVEENTIQAEAVSSNEKAETIGKEKAVQTEAIEAVGIEQPETVVEENTVQAEAMSNEKPENIVKKKILQIEAVGIEQPETVVEENTVESEAVSIEKPETIIKENTVQIEAVGIEKPEIVVEENTIQAETVSNEKPETVVEENTVEIEAVGIEKAETVLEESTVQAEAVSNEKAETIVKENTVQIESVGIEQPETVVEGSPKAPYVCPGCGEIQPVFRVCGMCFHGRSYACEEGHCWEPRSPSKRSHWLCDDDCHSNSPPTGPRTEEEEPEIDQTESIAQGEAAGIQKEKQLKNETELMEMVAMLEEKLQLEPREYSMYAGTNLYRNPTRDGAESDEEESDEREKPAEGPRPRRQSRVGRSQTVEEHNYKEWKLVRRFWWPTCEEGSSGQLGEAATPEQRVFVRPPSDGGMSARRLYIVSAFENQPYQEQMRPIHAEGPAIRMSLRSAPNLLRIFPQDPEYLLAKEHWRELDRDLRRQ